MSARVVVLVLVLACVLTGLCLPCPAWGQAPTIEQTGIVAGAMGVAQPGSLQSLLGPTPGTSGVSFGMQPGRDEMLLGRIGTAAPRVPTSITTPGDQGPPTAPRAIAAPRPIPAPQPLFFGSLELPTGEADIGPPDGLTLDQAIERLVHENLDLRAKALEIPQARADVLTASLRNNPILYADGQLVPYGTNSVRRPDGPTQYDLNVSHPLDLSHKRRARATYAARALQVMEAQYQDEVRRAIQLLYNAYVDALAARQTVFYAQTSVKWNADFLAKQERLKAADRATSADVDQAEAELQIARAGLLDAEEILRRAKRTLSELLNLPPEAAERLELRGTIEDLAPEPPPLAELIQTAQNSRPDIAAFRLGINAARANLQLQLANRFSDAYLLYQPFTFQNNAPFGRESGASWALGITVPVPLYNRNQGNLERARINVFQSQVQLTGIERRLITEVEQAAYEYRSTRQLARRIREQILPPLERARNARFKLFQEGEATVFYYLEGQRRYIDNVKAYHDMLVRHRRSMLALNTAVGERLLP
jgi:cobalt-zinc-cadmium efflux system outer membrane protein